MQSTASMLESIRYRYSISFPIMLMQKISAKN
jgi:hypothetical protein